ncbi:MAG: histidinol dehydrogenase [Myxococcota bacterium]
MSQPPLRLVRTDESEFEGEFRRLEQRRSKTRKEVDRVVASIVEDVRTRGDEAVLDAIERYDGYRLTPEELEVPEEEIEAAGAELDPSDREALVLAAERIRSFHAEHVPGSWRLERPDESLGQEYRPLARVGIVVPGFKAPLASTVLMTAIPAIVAGVRELFVVSPAQKHHPAILEAARLAGVTRVFRIGGAQGVAALAFGTRSVPPVVKIVGPGNVYVQAAKRFVFGQVGIDAEAGPSEVLIIADSSARPPFVAADLLAQAEHEEAASVVLVTPDSDLAGAVLGELQRQLETAPRREIARAALAGLSLAIVTRDIEEALELANRYGAEHLQIVTEDPEGLVPRIENAGAIFLGPWATVPLGDYVAGPSHVLPTGGTARFFSPLGVEDFLRRMSVVALGTGPLRRIGPSAVRLAELEGLYAHAQAVSIRLAGLDRSD